MQRHHSYPYATYQQQQPQPRYSTHSTSSAQSPSANPDEDWTKISDLAERRRIQNRIAQRNYRKKLKRRLEDLERRAGSSSVSPEQQPAEILPSQGRDEKKRRSSKPGVQSPGQGRSPIPPNTPQFGGREDQNTMFSRQYTRQLSASPPPAFTYSSFPGSEAPQPAHAPYPQHAPFNTLPAPYPDYPPQTHPVYLPPLPMTRPGYNTYDGQQVKPEAQYGEEEMMNHFNISYAASSGIDVPTTQSYADSNPYTPSLSDSHSFDHSRATSPSEQSMMCPQTPGSMSLSPHPVMGY